MTDPDYILPPPVRDAGPLETMARSPYPKGKGLRMAKPQRPKQALIALLLQMGRYWDNPHSGDVNEMVPAGPLESKEGE